MPGRVFPVEETRPAVPDPGVPFSRTVIRQQAEHAVVYFIHRAGVEQNGSVADHLGYASDVCGAHCSSAGHRLQNRCT